MRTVSLCMRRRKGGRAQRQRIVHTHRQTVAEDRRQDALTAERHAAEELPLLAG